MNPRKLMAVALCAAACVTTTVFAEEDKNGFESAPVIADPVNPKPGLLFSAYYYAFGGYIGMDGIRDCISKLPKMPAKQTGIDKSENFSSGCVTGVKEVNAIRWEGYFKCGKTAKYTFLFDSRGYYSITINGSHVITGHGEDVADVDLKTGWNKLEVIGIHDIQVMISARPKGSLATPTKLTPKMMFYDETPEMADMNTGL